MMLEQLAVLASVLTVQTAPVVDGRLDDDCWAKAAFESDLRLPQGVTDDGAPRKPTSFAVAQDGASVYLAVRCQEPDMKGLAARRDSTPWGECVEFYFAPDGGTFDFYQFAVGPTCPQPFAEFYSEGGAIRPDPYRPRWRHAIAFGKDGWTAEIAIPLSAFYMTRNSDWKSKWRMNFVRTTTVGSKPSVDYTWSPLERVSREPDKFRFLDGFPKRLPSEDVLVKTVAVKGITPAKTGFRGELACTVLVAEEGDYDFSVSCGGTRTVALKEGENAVSVPVAFPGNGRHGVHFAVTRKGAARPCERDYPVLIDFCPVRVRLERPGYRNCFYPGQDASVVSGRVAVVGNVPCRLSISGTGIRPQALTVRDGEPFSFDTRGFAVGEAVLTATAGDDTQTVRVRRLAPSARRMTWIEDGNLVVNGRPTIRRYLCAIDWHRGKANWERFQAERRSFRMTEELDEQLIIADRLIPGSEAREGTGDARPSDVVYRAMDARMAELSKEDFGGWYYVDEPECRNVSPVWLRHQYDYLTERDPYHVVIMDSRAGDAYLECTDVIQTHPYLGASVGVDGVRRHNVQLADFGSYVDAFGAAGRPDKVVGIVPTCFAYRWTSTRNDYPTLAEYVCGTWAGLVRGAKSVFPYAGHDLGDRAWLWEGTRYLFESIEALEDFLLFGRRETLSRSREAEVTRWTRGDEQLLVALNFTAERKSVEMPVRGRFCEFRGDRTFDFPSGPVALGPYETLVATTHDHDAGLETFAAMAKRAAVGEAERLSHDSQILERHDDVTITSNMEGAFGRYYKLIDGCRDMWAAASAAPDAYVEMSFPRFVPVFEKLRVYGDGLDALKVEVRKGGAWRELVPRAVRSEKYLKELDFGESVRALALRLTFPVADGIRRNVELYEIELPKAKGTTAAEVVAKAEPVADKGVVQVFSGDTTIVSNMTWMLADEARPKWAVMDLASFVPKTPRQYMAWHVRMETDSGKDFQFLASAQGDPEEAGLYTIRFDPPPSEGRKWIAFRDYGLDIGFGGLKLLDCPASRVELDGPAGRPKISLGDTVDIRVSLAEPCEELSAEFLYMPAPFNGLRPYAVNGRSGVELGRLDESGLRWGASVKLKSLGCDVPARCVYVRVRALGGGSGRPLLGNFSVPFARGGIRAATPADYGCDGKVWQYRRHAENLERIRKEKPKLVFIGDSIMHYWDEPEHGKALRDRYFSSGERKMLNLGYCSDHTEHVLWRLNEGGELDGYEAKCVVLMIGTNNTGHYTVEEEPPENTVIGIREILRTIRRKQPDAVIVLHAILARGQDASDPLRRRNETVNGEIMKFADGKRIFWCDFNDRLLTADGVLPREKVPDLLHPASVGYEYWHEVISPYIEYALSDRSSTPPPNRFASRREEEACRPVDLE